MAVQSSLRVAVLIRTHFASPKLTEMIEQLKGSEHFDLYVAVNESRGAVDIPGCAKIAYSPASFTSLGFDAKNDYDVVYCSDILFEHFRRCIPQYDFYALVEYDVALTQGGRTFFDDIAQKLGSDFRDLDVAAAQLGQVWQGWWHFPKAAKSFEVVYQAFFPCVIMSTRAVKYLYQWRLQEDSSSGNMQDRIFCEALVVTALNECGQDFKWLDVNDMLASTHSYDSFYFGLPMLDGVISPKFDDVKILHPVYPSAQFLEVHFRHAASTNSLRQYRAALDDIALPLDAGSLAFWRGRANADLAEHCALDATNLCRCGHSVPTTGHPFG
jgi:hypothetical protein